MRPAYLPSHPDKGLMEEQPQRDMRTVEVCETIALGQLAEAERQCWSSKNGAE